MSDTPPEPPAIIDAQPGTPSGAPVADVREDFERKTPQTEEDRAQAKAFIDCKIEMIRSDPSMSEEQKAAAVAELEGRR